MRRPPDDAPLPPLPEPAAARSRMGFRRERVAGARTEQVNLRFTVAECAAVRAAARAAGVDVTAYCRRILLTGLIP